MSHLPKDESANVPPAQEPLDSNATTDATNAADSSASAMPRAIECAGSPASDSPCTVPPSDQTGDYVPPSSIYLGETLDEPDLSTNRSGGAPRGESQAVSRPPAGPHSAKPAAPERFPSIP